MQVTRVAYQTDVNLIVVAGCKVMMRVMFRETVHVYQNSDRQRCRKKTFKKREESIAAVILSSLKFWLTFVHYCDIM